MEFGFKLDKEQVKALIELIEQHRCEGESNICSDLRSSIKKQYKEQYEAQKETMSEEEFLDNAKSMFGPNYCDSCD